MTVKTLLVLAAGVAWGCGQPARDSARPPRPEEHVRSPSEQRQPVDANHVTVDDTMLRDLRITTDEVESRAGGELIALMGELVVDQRAYAEVGAPMPARVERLLVSEGETVARGQALAELSSPELARARAEYLSAAARVKLADAALERKRGLAAEKIAPVREVQEAETAAADARGAWRAARAAIAGFGVDPPADDEGAATSPVFALRTPSGGSVIERTARVGQMLDPAVPAFRVGDLSTLWLMVHAFERDAVRIRRGVDARLAFPAFPGRDFRGSVAAIGRQVERESRTVPVRIDVKNPEDVLRPGMSATAALPVGASGASILTVPVAAVQRVRDQWCVFLPKSDSTFEIRRIGRGRDLAGEVEVLAGLHAGETVVVDGAFLLKAQAERGESDRHAH